MRFATIARTWRTGGHGVEMGFSDGISALAIIGLRYLSKGACPFDPEEEQKSRYWTGERLVEDAVVKYKKASGTCVCCIRAGQKARSQRCSMWG